jgi:hypothetical protein
MRFGHLRVTSVGSFLVLSLIPRWKLFLCLETIRRLQMVWGSVANQA